MRSSVFILLLCSCATVMAIEEPNYETVKEFEEFELRRYAPYLVAETTIKDNFDDAGGKAFNILAGYIFGKNRGDEKIEMTAPVNQQRAGEKIAMTAPVSQEASEDGYVFHFVMPAEYTMETLPEPVDPRVQLKQVEERLVAVRRYSGFWSESKYEENETLLRQALVSEGLEAIGKPVFARYDGPFTPWFMRRNEIWIEVREG